MARECGATQLKQTVRAKEERSVTLNAVPDVTWVARIRGP